VSRERKSTINIANSIVMPEDGEQKGRGKKQHQHREQHLDARNPVLVLLFFCGKKRKKAIPTSRTAS